MNKFLKTKDNDDYSVLKVGMKVEWITGTKGEIIGFAIDNVRGSCSLMIGVRWEDGAEMWDYTGNSIKKGELLIREE